jgi:hypothetical protein
VEQQGCDRELSAERVVVDPLDEVQVAVVDVDQLAVDGQGAATVKDWSPPAGVADLAGPAEVANGVRAELRRCRLT